MTYLELQKKIIDKAHRKDMATRAPEFIEDARVRLNYRLGLELVPLVADDDTNQILTDNWLLYFYPAMKGLYEFIEEFETASYYEQKYRDEADNYYITRPGQDTLVITPEVPAP